MRLLASRTFSQLDRFIAYTLGVILLTEKIYNYLQLIPSPPTYISSDINVSYGHRFCLTLNFNHNEKTNWNFDDCVPFLVLVVLKMLESKKKQK